MLPTLIYPCSGPSQRELNAIARRRFLDNKNTRWHGRRHY